MSQKIDGVAINLLYVDGMLVQALSRGDGTVGEDINGNARLIEDIPLRLASDNFPHTLEVRGEVFMRKADFEAYNQKCYKPTVRKSLSIRVMRRQEFAPI